MEDSFIGKKVFTSKLNEVKQKWSICDTREEPLYLACIRVAHSRIDWFGQTIFIIIGSKRDKGAQKVLSQEAKSWRLMVQGLNIDWTIVSLVINFAYIDFDYTDYTWLKRKEWSLLLKCVWDIDAPYSRHVGQTNFRPPPFLPATTPTILCSLKNIRNQNQWTRGRSWIFL